VFAAAAAEENANAEFLSHQVNSIRSTSPGSHAMTIWIRETGSSLTAGNEKRIFVT
jgi:hypothetical protein